MKIIIIVFFFLKGLIKVDELVNVELFFKKIMRYFEILYK